MVTFHGEIVAGKLHERGAGILGMTYPLIKGWLYETHCEEAESCALIHTMLHI
jgi:hypothetical protein